MKDLLLDTCNLPGLRTMGGAQGRLAKMADRLGGLDGVVVFVLPRPNGTFVPVAIVGPTTMRYAHALASGGVYVVSGR